MTTTIDYPITAKLPEAAALHLEATRASFNEAQNTYLAAARDAIIETAASVGIVRIEASWSVGLDYGDNLDLDLAYAADGTEVEIDLSAEPWLELASAYDTRYDAEQFSSVRSDADRDRGLIVFQVEAERLSAETVNDDHEEYEALRCVCDDIVSEEDGEPDGIQAVVPGDDEQTWIDSDDIDFDRSRIDLPEGWAWLRHAACGRVVTLPEGWRA